MGEGLIIRNNINNGIAQFFTGLYARLGYVNRNDTAEALHNMNTTTPDDVMKVLHEKHILKNSYNPATLQEIEPFMLRKTVETDTVKSLFIGADAPLQNIVSGLDKGYETVSRGFMVNPKQPSGMTHAFASGCLRAVAIGGLLLGMPAVAITAAVASPVATGIMMGVLVAANIYGLISAVCKHMVKDQNSTLYKFLKVGERVLAFSLPLTIAFGAGKTFAAFSSLSELLGPVLGGSVAALFGVTAVRSIAYIKRVKSTKHASTDPNSDKMIKSVSWSTHTRQSAGALYMLYRVVQYLTFGVGAAVIFATTAANPLVAGGLLGAGVLWRVILATTKNTKFGLWVSRDIVLKGAQKLTNTLSKDGDYHNHPILKMAIEYVLDTLVKWGPMAATLPAAAAPLGFFYELLSLYFGAFTLYADWHNTVTSWGLAEQLKRAVMNQQEEQFISDAERENLHVIVARLNAYVKETERNISKVVNPLIHQYNKAWVALCGETNPWADLDAVRSLKSARELLEIIRNMTKGIYDSFHDKYKNFKKLSSGASHEQLNGAAKELAAVFRKLGNDFWPDNNSKSNSYVQTIKDMISYDGETRKGAEKWFALDGEAAYLRAAYVAIKDRGDFFLEMADRLEKMADNDYVTFQQLEACYKKMLGNFSTEYSHIVRKIERLDDKFDTKTSNLSTDETHMGDTLYHVWRIIETDRGDKFVAERIPSNYVRVDNPDWDHLDENKRYIWVRREDYLEVLGISQAVSRDFKLVDVTPPDIKSKEEDISLDWNDKPHTVRGFYDKRDALPSNRIIRWNKEPVEIEKNKKLWVADRPAPPLFEDRFKQWARKYYNNKYAGSTLVNPSPRFTVLDVSFVVPEGDKLIAYWSDLDAPEERNVRIGEIELHINGKVEGWATLKVKPIYAGSILVNPAPGFTTLNISFVVPEGDKLIAYWSDPDAPEKMNVKIGEIELHINEKVVGWDTLAKKEKLEQYKISDNQVKDGIALKISDEDGKLYKISNNKVKDGIALKISDYDVWSEKTKSLWYINRPEVEVYAPAEFYNVSDENYIVINSEQELLAELLHEAREKKSLRVPYYETWDAKVANPDVLRPIQHMESIDRRDASMGIKYETKEGKFEIPYDEFRRIFVKPAPDQKFDFKKIDYGIIRVDSKGNKFIDVYEMKDKEGKKRSPEDKLIGTVDTFFPPYMHPVDEIIKDKYGDTVIYFELFKEHIGKATYLMADYGENYGTRLCDRLRFTRMEFDGSNNDGSSNAAKQQIWFNFTEPGSIKLSPDKKTMTLKTKAINFENFPVDKNWAGINDAKDVNVIEISQSGKIYWDKDGKKWSPVKENGNYVEFDANKYQLMQIRHNNGREEVVPVSGLPKQLRTPKDARNVIKVEVKDGKLTFIKLRRKDPLKDNPYYLYQIPPKLYNNPDHHTTQNKYQKLMWDLDKRDITVKIKDRNTVVLLDEQGNETDITIEAKDLASTRAYMEKPLGFLEDSESHMDSLDSFYQSDDNQYRGTEEYRPTLKKMNDRIYLILTRVEKIEVERNDGNEKVFESIASGETPDMLLANPTSAFKANVNGVEKWVPMSLTKPIQGYEPTPNKGTIAIKRFGKTEYYRINLPKKITGNIYPDIYKNKRDPKTGELPENVKEEIYQNILQIKSDPNTGKLAGWIFEEFRDENGDVDLRLVPAVEISEEIQKNIKYELNKYYGINDIPISDVVVEEVFYTQDAEVMDGEWQTVVHGQRQMGGTFPEETYPAVKQANARDQLFYGAPRNKFSDVMPAEHESMAPGQQPGRYDYDENGAYAAKPIENGTQFMANHHNTFELARVALGLPKGAFLAIAPLLNRAGGYEKVAGKDHFAKLVLYCREKGWPSGVSEDEQGVLGLALALGHHLKYFLKVTAFESQPNTWNQVNKQDFERYNTAMALGADVLIPYEMRELSKWMFEGKEIEGTPYKKLSHYLFSNWYFWPRAKMAQETAPLIFLLSNGHIRPYPVDPFFLVTYFIDFFSSVWMYATARKYLGFNKAQSGKSALNWALWEGPAMSNSFIFTALRGYKELFREGWQYGPFVITAQQKSAELPPEALKFVRGIRTWQEIAGTLAVIKAAFAFFTGKVEPLAGGYFWNLFWLFYSNQNDSKALEFAENCEMLNPENKRNEVKEDLDKLNIFYRQETGKDFIVGGKYSMGAFQKAEKEIIGQIKAGNADPDKKKLLTYMEKFEENTRRRDIKKIAIEEKMKADRLKAEKQIDDIFEKNADAVREAKDLIREGRTGTAVGILQDLIRSSMEKNEVKILPVIARDLIWLIWPLKHILKNKYRTLNKIIEKNGTYKPTDSVMVIKAEDLLERLGWR